MFVIGVASQAQHGKDTIADRIHLKLNEGGASWKRTAFASNVKRIYCETFGVDLDFVEKWKVIPECPPGFTKTVREGLQFIGDGFRTIYPTIWIDLIFRDLQEPIILSDVRYPNEFIRIKKEGGLNLLVARPDKMNDDPNGSEAFIKPYLLWCLNVFEPQFKFVDLTKVDFADFRRSYAPGDDLYPPDNMEDFDVFVRNDGTKEEFIDIVDSQAVPFAANFIFDFPETIKENSCLISS